jgi:uncharacterized NAD(P)/FAD-binding protein YdhS
MRDERIDFAIIGVGFSGLLLCAHLVRLAKKPCQIFLFDKSSFAKGTAYKTTSPVHFLNVKAGNMSAFPDDPDHFANYLDVDKNDYVPRMHYGRYLHSIWEETLQEAKRKDIAIEHLQKEVVKISYDGSFSIQCADDTHFKAQAAILACGVPDNKFFLPAHKNFTQNIWHPHSESILLQNDLSHLKDSHLAIIGSGLTMLDALATLKEKKFSGRITVISSDGKLPEVHRNLPPNTEKLFQSYIFRSALEFIHAVNTARKKMQTLGIDWRYVVDELRPFTQAIWRSFSLKEKKRLLPYLSLWNRHRHRMPEVYANLVKQTLHLQHVAGKIQEIIPHGNSFTINSSIEADFIFNCSGPEMDLEKCNSPLIKQLLKANMLKPDEIDFGAAIDENNSLIGKAKGSFFALGQLLFGTKLEITAVPELRVDALKLAKHLITTFSL